MRCSRSTTVNLRRFLNLAPLLVSLILLGFIPKIANAEQRPNTAIAKTPAPTLQPGQYRPGFKLNDHEDNLRDIAEWDGKVIVLNFWATWCPPCWHEIPVFNQLQTQYASEGVQFVGVALDPQHAVQRFIKNHGLQYPSLYGQQAGTELAKIYGNKYGGLPYTVVIGRDGLVLQTHAGSLNHSQTEQLILDAL